MFATIFGFAFITMYVAAEVPSYIHVCGRKDPNLDQCIVKSVENLKHKLCEGIPELNVQSLNPLLLDEVVVFNTSSMKLFIQDSEITGLCDFDVKSFHADVVEKLHFDIGVSFKQVHINGTYDVSLQLLVPIALKAHFYITANNVGAIAGVDMKIVTENDKRYLYLSKLNLNLDIKEYHVEIERKETFLDVLMQIVLNFINENQEAIILIFKPVLEETISKKIISFSNDIVTHYTYEEIFPDRI